MITYRVVEGRGRKLQASTLGSGFDAHAGIGNGQTSDQMTNVQFLRDIYQGVRLNMSVLGSDAFVHRQVSL